MKRDDYSAEVPQGLGDADAVPDSFAGRARREEPDRYTSRHRDRVGELVDPAGPVDHEERLVADETDSPDEGPEESAMHILPG